MVILYERKEKKNTRRGEIALFFLSDFDVISPKPNGDKSDPR
jgi:hypothetical protein